MDFIMPASASMPERKSYSPWLLALLLGLAALIHLQSAHAEQAFVVKYIETNLDKDVYQLNARIDFRFSDAALNALENGVPLLILYDIQVKQERWYWNKTLADLEQGYLLLYHALSEKFILQNLNSGAQEHFSSLDAALDNLGRISHLPLIDAKLLEPGSTYFVRLRAQLDIESLPAPMRPLAYISSEWNLESDWYRWPLNR
jgi:hypothetical protein